MARSATNGGTGAIAAGLAIPAITGKFGLRGQGLTMSNSGAWDLKKAGFVDGDAPREIPMSQVGRALTEWDEPAVDMVFIYNSNPVITSPDQGRIMAGLMREDLFTVVHEVVLTDTAKMADLVLPATHYMEHEDLARGYGALSLARVRPVVPAPPEARSNMWLFDTLTERLGLSKPGDVRDIEGVIRVLLEGEDEVSQRLGTEGQSAPSLGKNPIAFVDHFPRTEGQRIQLAPDPAWYAWEAPAFPGRLQVITPGQRDMISSTFGQLHPTPKVQMHPTDADTRGLSDGDRVVMRNALGEVEGTLSVTPLVRPGVLSFPKGAWREGNKTTVSTLVGDALTHFGGGPRYHDVWVEVGRLG